ncbi:GH12 family glycosyl hydrolase domain-containing protein [Kitasatospora sp. NBC_00458]|uniref:GH12 family glycosyl hydrolase domain-containing protein n=1 Tax=Kitasatospora sp. NBC_00458 TaxID=2903568 RepID=UPI002E17A5B5
MGLRHGFGRAGAAVLGAAVAVAGLLVPAGPAVAAESLHCGQYETVPVAGGRYLVDNNNYGPGTVQCLGTDGGSGFTVRSSNAAASPPAGPVAYPEIFDGCHWNTCVQGSALPVRVSELGWATSGWSTTLPAEGDFNVAYDLWFNTAPTTPADNGQPDGAELMIWLDRRPSSASPPGSTANIGGAGYTSWQQTISANGREWPMVAYQAQSPTTSVTDFDLRAFVRDAVVRGAIEPEWYLTSVEAGFEIWRGGTGLRTDSFSSDVRPGRPTGPVGAPGGHCLADLPGSVPAGPEPVALLDCDGSAAQQWSVEIDGTVRHAGKCLGTDGNRASLNPCNGSSYHVWLVGLVGALWNQGAQGCLRDPADGGASGGWADLSGCDGSPAQRWTLPTAVV